MEIHNGYDFAPAERAAEERAEETAPSRRWTRRRWSGAIPTNRKRRSAPS
ncbi:MAG: hypothetical protein ACLSHJ_02195 [Oscillospiraceae bacterium]